MRSRPFGRGCTALVVAALLAGVGVVWLWNAAYAEIWRCCPLVGTEGADPLVSPFDKTLLASVVATALMAALGAMLICADEARTAQGRRFRPRRTFLTSLIGLALTGLIAIGPGRSLVEIANVRLDRGAPAQHTAQVLDKRSQANRASVSYLLLLRSWRADYGERVVVQVARELFDAVEPGTNVRLQTRPGLLGAEWVEWAELDQ